MDESSFERLINIQSFSDDELKALAKSLAEQETAVSKQRRLLQGELDIVRAELVRRLRDSAGASKGLVADGDVTTLADILASKGSDKDAPES